MHGLALLSGYGGCPVSTALVLAVQFQFLQHHRDIIPGHFLGYQEFHHPVHRIGVGRRWQRAPAVAQFPDYLQGPRADGRLAVFIHITLEFIDVHAHGSDLAIEQASVSTHMNHRHDQAGDAGIFQRGGNGGIVLVDTEAGGVLFLAHD